MLYRFASDAVLVLHVAFIAFVVVGLVVIVVGAWRGWGWVRRPGLRLAHLAAIGYVVVQAWCGMVCPLTTLESALRVRAGQNPYAPGGFVASWLRRLIFFDAPPGVFTAAYTAFALAVVATLVWAPIRWGKRGGG